MEPPAPPQTLRDTTPEAELAYWEIIRNMTPEQRWAQTFALSRRTREIKRAGLRAQHPGLDEQQISLLLIQALHGEDAYQRACRHMAECNDARRNT